MRVFAYIMTAFSAGIVGVSLAAVTNALAVPTKMAFYSNCKGFIRWVPWICAGGAVTFTVCYFVPLFSLSLPNWAGALILFGMGMMLGMNAVSLAEMTDVFIGPFNFVRMSEFRWIVFFIAIGKAVFSALRLMGGFNL